MKKLKIILTVILGITYFGNGFSQDRIATIETKLKELSKDVPGLNEKVELSVNGVVIQDFIRGLAMSNNLNVSVSPNLTTKIYNNFTNVTVQDVFLFLCRNHELDITFVGPIMTFSQYTAPVVPTKYVSRQIKITYDKATNLVSFDLGNDSLSLVAKEIARASGKNVVFSPDLAGKTLSGYIQSMPFDNAMDKLAFANDLKVTLTSDNFYLVEKKDKDLAAKNTGSKSSFTNAGQKSDQLKIENGFVTLDVNNKPISEIVDAVSGEMKIQYFLFSELKGNATLNIKQAGYEDFLRLLLNGTDFTFKKEGEIYLLGDRNLEGLRATKLVQLKYRTADKIVDFIPAELKKGVDIKIFPDLNGIILSGSQPRINEIEAFLTDVDRVVPVVQIEVIIADIRKSHIVSTGIEAGLKTGPHKTQGTVFPGIDLNINSSTINSIISGINGFGLINLGNVTPQFYITLTALETQGVLKLRSTPQLATLNGHEATLTVGTTEYYQEQQSNIFSNQTTTTQTTIQYKPINAELGITINPTVSGDEQITLDITVKQQSFTARIAPTAPPGMINRNFKSMVRVKNGEMIMLGGLDENTDNDTGSGVPLLSRIPVIKWLFSKRTKEDKKSRLTVFIKPTVIY